MVAPSLTNLAVGPGNTLEASGSFEDGVNGTEYTLEVFASPSCPAAGPAGQTFVGSGNVVAPGNGQTSFSLTGLPLPKLKAITVTVTDPVHGTTPCLELPRPRAD